MQTAAVTSVAAPGWKPIRHRGFSPNRQNPFPNQSLLGNKGLPLEEIRRRLFMIDPTVVIGVNISEGASEQLPNPRVGLRLR